MARASFGVPIARELLEKTGPGGNTPGRIRTCDRRFRRPLLYPAELRARGEFSALVWWILPSGAPKGGSFASFGMRPAGLEPAACGLGNRRSIHLSYERRAIARRRTAWALILIVGGLSVNRSPGRVEPIFRSIPVRRARRLVFELMRPCSILLNLSYHKRDGRRALGRPPRVDRRRLRSLGNEEDGRDHVRG